MWIRTDRSLGSGFPGHYAVHLTAQSSILKTEDLLFLKKTSEDLQKEEKCCWVVLKSLRKDFCCGADLQEMLTLGRGPWEENLAQAELLASTLGALSQIPQPVVALCQGWALGGGLGILSTADWVLADKTARFGTPEVKLGLIPAVIFPHLVRRIPLGILTSMILSGCTHGAKDFSFWIQEVSHLEEGLKTLEASLTQANFHAQRAAKSLWTSSLDTEGEGARKLASQRARPETQKLMEDFLFSRGKP